jgi:hypothetical protein
MTVCVSECDESSLSCVRVFMARVYRSSYVLANDETLLRWQFGGVAGDARRYHIKVATIDGAVAACLGYIPVEISVAGRTLRGAWTANWIADPAVKQHAMGLRLMRELVDEHDLTLVVGASGQARHILPRMGFTYFGDLRRHICVIDTAAAAALSDTARSVWTRMTTASGCSAVNGTERVETFQPPVERVWDSVWARHGLGTRRTAAFLNWRYASHPRFGYRMFITGPVNTPTGFAVYRIEPVNDDRWRVGRIVEFVAGPAAAETLLGAVMFDARSSGVGLLDYFCSAHPAAPAFARCGWFPEDALPAPVPMLLQPITAGRRAIPFLGHVRKAGGVPLDLDCWYVTKGDGDQDRPN